MRTDITGIFQLFPGHATGRAGLGAGVDVLVCVSNTGGVFVCFGVEFDAGAHARSKGARDTTLSRRFDSLLFFFS